MRALGIDPGGKRLGLAVGDDVTGAATPLEVVQVRGQDDAAAVIARVAADHGAVFVVVGLPTAADGAETPACARSHALVAALAALGITARLQPEHLTSHEARRRARILGRRPDAAVDDIAAAVILEDFFSTRRTASGRS